MLAPIENFIKLAVQNFKKKLIINLNFNVMKKFYMILAALLIGSVCFAQKTMTISERHMINGNSANNTRETGWYGNSAYNNAIDMVSGEYYVMRPETYSGATTVGEQVQKIKFMTIDPSMIQGATGLEGYTNLSFTIKIYEGCAMGENLINNGYTDGPDENAVVLGTLAKTIPYTATAMGEQEVVLAEPYTITSATYWIAIECNGNTLFAANTNQVSTNTVTPAQYQNDEYPTLPYSDFSNVPYLILEDDNYDDLDVVVGLSYTDNTHSAIAYFESDPYFQIYVQGSGAYVPTYDFEARFFGGISNNQLTEAQASYTLNSATDQLSLIPAFTNNGLDNAVEGTVTVDLTIAGVSLMNGGSSMQLDGSEQGTIPANSGWIPLLDAPYTYTITAQDLIDAGLSGTFDVCLTVSYTGNDPNTANNSHCIPVTLNVASVEENIAEAVSVYPNPANDMFTVANAEGATIVVVNSLGQVVASIENAASNQTIDASNFANGTYFVKVNESVVKINVVK